MDTWEMIIGVLFIVIVLALGVYAPDNLLSHDYSNDEYNETVNSVQITNATVINSTDRSMTPGNDTSLYITDTYIQDNPDFDGIIRIDVYNTGDIRVYDDSYDLGDMIGSTFSDDVINGTNYARYVAVGNETDYNSIIGDEVTTIDYAMGDIRQYDLNGTLVGSTFEQDQIELDDVNDTTHGGLPIVDVTINETDN